MWPLLSCPPAVVANTNNGSMILQDNSWVYQGSYSKRNNITNNTNVVKDDDDIILLILPSSGDTLATSSGTSSSDHGSGNNTTVGSKKEENGGDGSANDGELVNTKPTPQLVEENGNYFGCCAAGAPTEIEVGHDDGTVLLEQAPRTAISESRGKVLTEEKPSTKHGDGEGEKAKESSNQKHLPPCEDHDVAKQDETRRPTTIITSLSSMDDTTADSIIGKSIDVPKEKSLLDGMVSFDDDSELLLVGERHEDEARFRASLATAPDCPLTVTALPRPKRRFLGCAGLVCGGGKECQEIVTDEEVDLGTFIFDLDEIIIEGDNEDDFDGIPAASRKSNIAGSIIADRTKVSSIQDSRTNLFSASDFFSDLMGAKECDFCREKLSLDERRIKENRAHDVEDGASVYFHLACHTARKNIIIQTKLVQGELWRGNLTPSSCTSGTTKRRFKKVRKGVSLVARMIKKCLKKRPKLKRLGELVRGMKTKAAPEAATTPMIPKTDQIAPETAPESVRIYL